MKRYDKMSKEEIMEVSKRFMELCELCPLDGKCDGSGDCREMYDKYMHEELKMVPRCHTCKTADDFEEMWKAFTANIKNGEVFAFTDLAKYMMEEVPKDV